MAEIERLKRLVDQVLASSARRPVHERLAYLAQQGLVSMFLKLALSDQEQLRLIASRSYAHYNNFDKIVLLSCPDSPYDLRLHVWWPDECQSARENIHDHKWDFSSVVLKGEYYFEIYELSPVGFEMYEHRYFTRAGRDQYDLPVVSKERLNCISAGEVRAGDAYTMTNDILHRVVCSTHGVTATLVVQSRKVKDYARVFTDKPDELLQSIRSMVFSVKEISEKFERLLRML